MRHLLRRFKIELLLFLGVFLAFLAPILLTRSAIFPSLNFTGTGQIGDTIGGIAGPILNFVGLILLYYSFREQFKANQIQVNALREEHSRNQNSRNFEILNGLITQFRSELDKIPNLKVAYFGFRSGSLRDEDSLPSVNLKNLLLWGEHILEKVVKGEIEQVDRENLLSLFYFHFYFKLGQVFFDFQNNLHFWNGEDRYKEKRKSIDEVLFRIKAKLDDFNLEDNTMPLSLSESETVDPDELKRPAMWVV
jgi:hypothetical protein